MAERTNHHKVAEHIRNRIKSGGLKRGDRLPSFEQLHRQLGAARATVSKAFGTLELDGLVERRSRSGVFVACSSPQKRKTRVLVSSPSMERVQSDYWTRLFVGIQTAAHDSGVEVAFLSSFDDLNWEEYSGLLAFGAETWGMSYQRPAGLPVVSMCVPAFGVPSVTLNEYEAGFIATKHLIDLGHSNIAFLGWMATSPICFRLAGYYEACGPVSAESLERLRAYQSTFERIAPAYDDRLVRGLGFARTGRAGYIGGVERDSTSLDACVGGTKDSDHAYDNMAQWFDDGFERLDCTAIVVQNDFFAEGVIAFLTDRGYRVPGDISVIGFDNERTCAMMTPPLTSVGGDMAQLGACAMKTILRVIDGEEVANTTLPVHVFVRESTCPASPRRTTAVR